MATGIGVGLGVCLLALAGAIQHFRFLPALIRMRIVALFVLLGSGAAIVPTIIGTWTSQGIHYGIAALGDLVRPYDAGWASFFTTYLLPLLALLASALWLAYFLPRVAQVVFGDVATNDFDQDDYLIVWGGGFLIALLWSSSLGPLGDTLHAPIEWIARTAGPMANKLLGGN